MKFWAVTHKHTAYVEAETEVEAMENCADQVRDNAEADDCTAEEISEHEYEQHWALIENGTHVKKKRTRRVSVPSPALLAETITALADSFDRDLFSQTKEQLEERWFFAFDASKSVEANIYSFHDMLKLYGGFCRRWEEHHNGPCCVVERVRDQYLWPKIKRFADDMRAMITANARLQGCERSEHTLQGVVGHFDSESKRQPATKGGE